MVQYGMIDYLLLWPDLLFVFVEYCFYLLLVFAVLLGLLLFLELFLEYIDYYTGLIYETVLTDTDKVGSISGGGRYDNLVGMFSGKQIPAVGVSIGIERIFNILEEKYKNSPDIRSVETEVFVAVIGKKLTKERFKVLNELWNNGIKAEILYNENPRMDKQMDYAVNNKIPFMVFIGENELKENKLKIKCMANGNEIMIERGKLVEEINELKKKPELLKVEGGKK